MQAVAFSQAAAVAAITMSSVIYETFIPPGIPASPPLGCGPYNGSTFSFKGDNRGFLANDVRYRTRSSVNIFWLAGGAIDAHNSVGATHVVRTATKAVLATRTTSTAGMSIKRLALSNSSHVDLRFNISATNPFCTGIPNSIESVFTLIVTRSRSWSIISGSHKLMPNHELYLSGTGGGFVRAYARSFASRSA